MDPIKVMKIRQPLDDNQETSFNGRLGYEVEQLSRAKERPILAIFNYGADPLLGVCLMMEHKLGIYFLHADDGELVLSTSPNWGMDFVSYFQGDITEETFNSWIKENEKELFSHKYEDGESKKLENWT